MSTNLFAYGTLLVPTVMERVTGKQFRSLPATLRGYVCRTLRGETYPGIAAFEGDDTPGCVFLDIDRTSMALLDRFEDDLYRKEEVEVRAADGRTISAVAYVVPESRSHLLSDRPWDLEHFTHRHLDSFLASIDDRLGRG